MLTLEFEESIRSDLKDHVPTSTEDAAIVLALRALLGEVDRLRDVIHTKSWMYESNQLVGAKCENDELRDKLAVAIGALEAIAHWKSDANVCCFPVNCYEVLDKIRGEK